ncbi:uncharacterized protein LOC133195350 [Saccostrea echinata]|uniref:uncharacterized protein LOC133195350 n=1 Tax=Saccostrea echinata TaxID=191078 RepID=UPI002A7F6B1B|nr:uncharacterized protein LOC133195350 [Saccostrea echinata]
MSLPSRNSVRKGNGQGLRALAAGSLALARAHVELLKTEKFLENEIEKENRKPPDCKIGRLRFTGHHLLHSKNILLFIVVLNVLDCILVMAELFLDIYYLKGVMDKEELSASLFMAGMKHLYPHELMDIAVTDIDGLYNRILSSNVDFYSTTDNQHVISALHSSDTVYSDYLPASNHSVFRRSVVNEMPSPNNTIPLIGLENGVIVQYGLEVKLAHLFHYFSISILAILVIENIFKFLCSGREFFEKKIEVFDAMVVIFSFILDLVFIKGVHAFKVQKFLVILIILVPWRIIRVVNSLIVAVTDHAHFRMKLLYKQKKTVTQELKACKCDIETLQDCVQSLRELASMTGIPETEIDAQIAAYHVAKKKEKQHTTTGVHTFLPSFLVGHLSPTDHTKRSERLTSTTSETSELISVHSGD